MLFLSFLGKQLFHLRFLKVSSENLATALVWKQKAKSKCAITIHKL